MNLHGSLRITSTLHFLPKNPRCLPISIFRCLWRDTSDLFLQICSLLHIHTYISTSIGDKSILSSQLPFQLPQLLQLTRSKPCNLFWNYLYKSRSHIFPRRINGRCHKYTRHINIMVQSEFSFYYRDYYYYTITYRTMMSLDIIALLCPQNNSNQERWHIWNTTAN